MKTTLSVALTIILILSLTGCFVLEFFFPPIGGGTSRIALYVNYNSLKYSAHNLSGVELVIDKVELLSSGTALKEKEEEKVISIDLRPNVKITSFSSLLQLLGDNFIAQLEFEKEENEDITIKTPTVRLTFDKSATAVYTLQREGEETTFATRVALEIPAKDLTVSIPIKELTNQYRNKATLTLPVGQSTLYVMLNLLNIPTHEETLEMSQPIVLENGFINSISLLQGESCLVHGTIEDKSEQDDPALKIGENWTLGFFDNLFINENNFVASAYTTVQGSAFQNYYFVVPLNNYNAAIYLKPPGLEDEDGFYTEISISTQETSKQAEKLVYPPGQE